MSPCCLPFPSKELCSPNSQQPTAMPSTAMMLLAAVLVVGTLAANIKTEDGTLTLVVDQGQEPFKIVF